MIRRGMTESPAPEQEKPERVTRNSNQKRAGVEAHHRQHHHVGQPDPNRVHSRLSNPGGDVVGAFFEKLAIGEPLDEDGEHEDKQKGQQVHAQIVVSGPTREQDLGVLPPEEGHVHHHVVGAHRRHSSARRRAVCHIHSSGSPGVIHVHNYSAV
ncbi:OLC1v1006108C1 [Oldenlandia corymbosa var. corymbosa]|uniref:OLC1v1006108C1 n=1 Tax=Oldenlandia corymbosa var. corymbosa TaxID=529605 RepID=A0AAV1DIP1_OLDCO|nr:OLC1v1006108C1 [Oldenlandia corymbosa var. corymbosa]